jgi:hypothetical protein
MGVGIQVQIQIGSFVGGVELIWNLSNSAYLFAYAGVTAGTDKLHDLLDFIKNLKNYGLSGFWNSIKEFCTPISTAFSVSVFAVFGKHTKLPNDYKGGFKVRTISFSKYTFSYAFSKEKKQYIASAGFGFQTSGTFTISLSKTFYFYLYEFKFNGFNDEVNKKVCVIKKYSWLF